MSNKSNAQGHAMTTKSTTHDRPLRNSMDKSGQSVTNLPSINVPTLSTTTSATTSTGSLRPKKSRYLVNHDFCYYCDEGGNLLNCDRCPASFHLMCHEPPLDIDQIPKGEFLCNKCKAKARLLVGDHTSTSSGVSNAFEKQLFSLPISQDTRTIEFELVDKESSINTLIRMAKSLNPRQMQLSASLGNECAIDMPGYTKLKWWKREPGGTTGASVSLNNPNSNGSCASSSRLGAIDSTPNGAVISMSARDQEIQFINGVNEKTTSKSKSNGSKANGFGSNSNFKICFLCQKNSKASQLAKCDFCPLVYHLNCLNPPLCAMPPRDRLWMCPNHVEHFIDSTLLSSNRLTERIKLWHKYSLDKIDANTIKLDFLNKCNNLKIMPPEHEHYHVNRPTSIAASLAHTPILRCKIPDTVKLMYSTTYKPATCQQPSNRDDSEIETLEQVAIEALGLLSQAPSSTLNHDSCEMKQETQVQHNICEPPSLFKQCKESIKPRALLQYVPQNLIKSYNVGNQRNLDEFLNYLIRQNELQTPFNLVYRSLTIGMASNMDICLSKLLLKPSPQAHSEKSINCSKSHCKFISDKHACIYYDEETNHFELLNYSEHGTIVDNCLYGQDIGMYDDDEEDDEELESIENEFIYDYGKRKIEKEVRRSGINGSTTMSSRSLHESNAFDHLTRTCLCETKQNRRIEAKTSGSSLWEGPAILNHGSHIRIGCYDFLFIVVDYDFVNKLSKHATSNVRTLTREQLTKTARLIKANASRHLKRLANNKRLRIKSKRNENVNGASNSTSNSRLKKNRHKKPTTNCLSRVDKFESLLNLLSNENKLSLINT